MKCSLCGVWQTVSPFEGPERRIGHIIDGLGGLRMFGRRPLPLSAIDARTPEVMPRRASIVLRCGVNHVWVRKNTTPEARQSFHTYRLILSVLSRYVVSAGLSGNLFHFIC